MPWQERAEEIREVSGKLFEERGHAFYGDEDELLPPADLFGREEAEEAIRSVEWLLDLYRGLLRTAAE